MSVAYEPRYHDDSPYAPVGESGHDTDHSDLNKYINTEANVDMADLAAATYEPSGDEEPSPFDASSPGLDLGPIAPPNVDSAHVPIHETSPAIPDGERMPATPPRRSNPIPKPDRPVTKNDHGQFVCQHAGCTEETKTFNRKCEWSKHMDKHERPYICTVPGCEKVQGFTYSGGLLRHEREVHGKHGGPKKAMFCPHPNCKRNTGKGFSRLENLQEHLRRVHTPTDSSASITANATTTVTAAAIAAQLINSPAEDQRQQQQQQHNHAPSPESTSDMASAAFAFIRANSKSPDDSLITLNGHENDERDEGVVIGNVSTINSHKRKRSLDYDAGRVDDGAAGLAAAQEEIKRLRAENKELRQQLGEQTKHAERLNTQLLAVKVAIIPAGFTIMPEHAPEQPAEL